MTVLSPYQRELNQEFTDLSYSYQYIQPQALDLNHLYFGEGGNVGRVGIFRGMDTAGRVSFEGYIKRQSGLELKQEALPTSATHGSAFNAIEHVNGPAPDISDHNLVDWLLTMDISFTQERIVRLKHLPQHLQKSTVFKDEVVELTELLKLLTKLQSY